MLDNAQVLETILGFFGAVIYITRVSHNRFGPDQGFGADAWSREYNMRATTCTRGQKQLAAPCDGPQTTSQRTQRLAKDLSAANVRLRHWPTVEGC